MTRMTGPDCAVMCNLINIHTYIRTYIHTYIHTFWEDQREWHRMTSMTRPDCAVMCNLINIHTYIHTTLCRYINYKWVSINISYICHVEHHMTPAIDKRGIITYSYHKERTKKIK